MRIEYERENYSKYSPSFHPGRCYKYAGRHGNHVRLVQSSALQLLGLLGIELYSDKYFELFPEQILHFSEQGKEHRTGCAICGEYCSMLSAGIWYRKAAVPLFTERRGSFGA